MRAQILRGILLVSWCCRGGGTSVTEHLARIESLASFLTPCQPAEERGRYYLDYHFLPPLLDALKQYNLRFALPAYKVVAFAYAFAGVTQERIPVPFKGAQEDALVIAFTGISAAGEAFTIKALWEESHIRFFMLSGPREQRSPYPCEYAKLPSLLEVPKARWEAVFGVLQRDARLLDYAQSVESIELVFNQNEPRWHWIGGGCYHTYGIPMGLKSGCSCVKRLYSALDSGAWPIDVGDCEALRNCAADEQWEHRTEVERGCRQLDPRFLSDRHGNLLHLKPGLFLGLGGSYEFFWDASFSTRTPPHALH